MGGAWERTKRITTGAFRPVRGRDLSLHAASITFYGAIAVVPVALLAIWLTSLLVGASQVRRLTGYAVEALPDAIGAPHAVAALVEAGVGLTPWLALAALLPASLYGEGLRRAFVSVAAPRSDEHLVGWRGRLLLLPLLAPAPALLLSILLALPTTTGLVRRGGWAGALGVVLSFLAVWLVLTPVLMWVFRVVGPASPDWLATLGMGSFTAANLSGFLHGFVLFASLPLDLGVPFGGLDEVGAAVAILLWLYLFHVIVLAGYSATLALSAWRQRRKGPVTS
ncbi:YihY/virulence factor BrkB family protein [Verrucosispora sp. WMMA2044]|uniref:YihY/virulence factor BrkB family protein n=1 Tax=Verrucosispora sioxanthis TaxID=2499994 RepID=A0A6M1L146_9ACTN|nr:MULTISPECIES: YhjD/YihY/BrkB family envelope integrity protein [Micromonospora]NEE62731.1 YihY/virulence factor BrkB family protein [Verrucosispora sioxanthis]NGM11841.1 YihY/virulence factor BrkB family protein [Verrucosispora sioxanthis]WBB47100.1 YihY/virulence factor BrkB family protein [Verrucosispora sp. WMMA2044]